MVMLLLYADLIPLHGDADDEEDTNREGEVTAALHHGVHHTSRTTRDGHHPCSNTLLHTLTHSI